jgi:putative methyltransferase (TIGR04325 family)
VFKFLRSIIYFYKYYSGPYRSWIIAQRKSIGYNDSNIISKVRKSALIAKNSKSKFEIDSIIFSKPYRNIKFEKILANLAKKKKSIKIIDFGGSLGSTYYRYRDIFSSQKKVKWSIIEQKAFVEIGKKEFKDKNLDFYYNLEEFINKNINKQIDIFLLSSSLQYIKNYKKIINKVNKLNVNYVIILKTPMKLSKKNEIYVEKVPEQIYGTSYSSWVFSKVKLINSFTNYKLVYDKIVNPHIFSIYFHDLFLKKND